MSPQPTTDPASSTPAFKPLPRPVVEFLMDLALAVQRHAIYPSGHPQLGVAIDRLIHRLDGILASQPAISLAIARTQIIVEDAATDSMNPLMRDLAQRLHRQRLGAMRLLAGLPHDELADFLAVVATDPEGPQIALTSQLQRWPHIALSALDYNRLELLDGERNGDTDPPASAALIWIALARATLMPVSGDGNVVVDPAILAEAINAYENPAYDQSIVGFLLEITESLKGATGEEAAMVRSQMSDLIRTLEPQTLERLLELGGDLERRKRFVLDASQHLTAGAVIALLRAAADASKQGIPHTLLRVMGKLAMQAEQGGAVVRAGANAALRDQVEQLVDHWDPTRLNPESYQSALDRMAQRRVSTSTTRRRHPCEPERLIMTSIEADALGAPVWLAVDQLIARGSLTTLLDLLSRAPADNEVATTLWPLVATPERLRHFLQEEQIDLALLERVATRSGAHVVDLLLDALETTENRAARRRLLDLVARLGSHVSPRIIQRLNEDAPWYVQRNLLTLLAMLPELPPGFVPSRFLAHSDARVRREALKILLRTREHRDSSILVALSDRDDGIVQIALTTALEACPANAIPLIKRIVERPTVQSEVRALGIRVVGAARAAGTLEWLLAQVVTTSKLLRRERLLPKSPEMLAALAGLALGWRDDPRAAAVLALAVQSKDNEIKAAVGPRRRTTSERTHTLS